MARSRHFIFLIAASLTLGMAALVQAAHAPGAGGRLALGPASTLDERPLIDILSAVRSSKVELRAAPEFGHLVSPASLRLCEADAIAGACEPGVPFRAGTVRILMPGGREHRSVSSSGSTSESSPGMRTAGLKPIFVNDTTPEHRRPNTPSRRMIA